MIDIFAKFFMKKDIIAIIRHTMIFDGWALLNDKYKDGNVSDKLYNLLLHELEEFLRDDDEACDYITSIRFFTDAITRFYCLNIINSPIEEDDLLRHLDIFNSICNDFQLICFRQLK